jgi:hypothetical protein
MYKKHVVPALGVVTLMVIGTLPVAAAPRPPSSVTEHVRVGNYWGTSAWSGRDIVVRPAGCKALRNGDFSGLDSDPRVTTFRLSGTRIVGGEAKQAGQCVVKIWGKCAPLLPGGGIGAWQDFSVHVVIIVR